MAEPCISEKERLRKTNYIQMNSEYMAFIHSKTSFSAKNKKSDCFWLIIAKKDCYLHLNGTIIAVNIIQCYNTVKNSPQ